MRARLGEVGPVALDVACFDRRENHGGALVEPRARVLHVDVETRVFAPEPPQTNVIGTITGTTVEIISEPLCPFACGDINGSGGLVNLVDFATFAVCFNLSPLLNVGCACSDLNQDCRINLVDFATFGVLFQEVSTNLIPDCIP